MEFVNMGHNSEKHEHAEEEGAAHVRYGYGHITEQDPVLFALQRLRLLLVRKKRSRGHNKMLIGGNLKTQVLASQIGQHISKNTILNVSGKLFAGSEPADQDHELLVELVALVKAVLQSQPA
ncbi:hypothetical protein KL911_002428 [Ogataea haglerorum]|uniref:uncharacterized protein n=1 Tax=Ogataea haglerorum TaxID=1937702 RepID=UPI001C8A0717|nr:uncharacterized protein KL911_002428 [Ogataea haglerorum]KAG7753952.1 hypothetical protein KL911_002428 [Ogataea haglerorum]